MPIFKANTHKAFDTLNWNLLLTSLRARGLPQIWIQWIENSVLQGYSQVMVNGRGGSV
jgi:hypothetical protein